jgi:hypothetical protein
MLDMLGTKQAQTEIDGKRAEIIRNLLAESASLKSPDLTAISTADLSLLFRLYDRVFLQNWFRDNYRGKLKFSLSGKMTKSAGKTLCPKNIGRIRPEELVLEIRIGVDFFLGYGRHSRNGVVCGIRTQNSLEALMLVFEHEICHVLEFLLFHKSSCKGKRFKAMAYNAFGHTESYHQLSTNRQVAAKTYGFRPGDAVSFEFKGKRFSGLIYSINKRATVLVTDKKGTHVDRSGTRYLKYYVPLTRLQRYSS